MYQQLADILLESPMQMTSDGFGYVPVEMMSPEQIQAIADVALQSNFDVDIRTEHGQDLMVFVPIHQSDEPLAHDDMRQKQMSDLRKQLKKINNPKSEARDGGWAKGVPPGGGEIFRMNDYADPVGIRWEKLLDDLDDDAFVDFMNHCNFHIRDFKNPNNVSPEWKHLSDSGRMRVKKLLKRFKR